MTKYLKHFWLACILLWSTAGFTQERSEPFKITISSPASVIESGQEIPILVTLTNTTRSEISLSQERSGQHGECYYSIEVKDASGKSPVYKEYGQRSQGKSFIPFQFNRVVVSMEPHGTMQETIELNTIYDRTAPGTYLVQVERRFPEELGGGVIKSNQVTITIAPKKAADGSL